MLKDLYAQAAGKTRVLITDQNLESLFHYVLDFHGKETDRISAESSNLNENDFVILCTTDLNAATEFHPNIVLLTLNVIEEELPTLLNNMTSGGVVIYPENQATSSAAVDAAEIYFRKIPYQESEWENSGGIYYVKTEMGLLPVNIGNEAVIKNLDALRLLAQQFGILEEDFYEAVLAYRTI